MRDQWSVARGEGAVDFQDGVLGAAGAPFVVVITLDGRGGDQLPATVLSGRCALNPPLDWAAGGSWPRNRLSTKTHWLAAYGWRTKRGAPFRFSINAALFRLFGQLARGDNSKRVDRYQYGDAEYDRAHVRIDPQREFSAGAGLVEWRDSPPRRSLTICSTYRLEQDMPGAIVE
jgi:hypothetical protein